MTNQCDFIVTIQARGKDSTNKADFGFKSSNFVIQRATLQEKQEAGVDVLYFGKTLMTKLEECDLS